MADATQLNTTHVVKAKGADSVANPIPPARVEVVRVNGVIQRRVIKP